MASAPRGLLRLIALQMLSESSLSGSELQEQIRRSSAGAWEPGPGSIYFMVAELRKGDLIVELPLTTGTTRRYVISNKGRAELERLRGTVQKETRKQLEILAYYCELAGDRKLSSSIRDILAKT
ncbi:MAG: helix-turn-helix transcriptional regulator [Nitrososphaerales archaeon]